MLQAGDVVPRILRVRKIPGAWMHGGRIQTRSLISLSARQPLGRHSQTSICVPLHTIESCAPRSVTRTTFARQGLPAPCLLSGRERRGTSRCSVAPRWCAAFQTTSETQTRRVCIKSQISPSARIALDGANPSSRLIASAAVERASSSARATPPAAITASTI